MGNWRSAIPQCRRKLCLWRSRFVKRFSHAMPLHFERQRNRSDIIKILNFSSMWEILPFYGYLDEWWVLMTSLWKDSNRVWNRNINAFEFRGREFIRYSQIRNLKSLKMYNDIPLLFWRQSNYIKRLVYLSQNHITHVCWIVNVIRSLRNGMILSIINNI